VSQLTTINVRSLKKQKLNANGDCGVAGDGGSTAEASEGRAARRAVWQGSG